MFAACCVASGIILHNGQNVRKTIEVFDVQATTIPSSSSTDFLPEENNTKVVLLSEKTAMYPEYVFEPTDEKAYFISDSVLKDIPYENGEDTTYSYSKYDEIALTGKNDLRYWEITINGKKYYVDSQSITTDKSVIEEMQEAERKAEEERLRKEEEERKRQEQEQQQQRSSYSNNWDGSKLTRSKGVNYGPTGKETYYNLPMGGVVSIMRNMGFSEEDYPYWVRDDGCKMLGPYIMVAANLDAHPRGTTVECSLGTALVCDTGGFASMAEGWNWLDIAVNW